VVGVPVALATQVPAWAVELKQTAPLEEFVLREANPERLRALYADWGFKTLLAQLSEGQPQQGTLL